MSSKKGTVVPKTGTVVHPAHKSARRNVEYARVVSAGLRAELGKTHRATKTVMRWTGASERTVKTWFAATRGPSGEHLVTLVRHSDAVLDSFLRLSARERAPADQTVAVIRARLIELLLLVDRPKEGKD